MHGVTLDVQRIGECVGITDHGRIQVGRLCPSHAHHQALPVRAPKGCPISGAVRWLSPQKALVQLSMRGLANDVFWFTVFHECGHIALHGKKMVFLEHEGMSGEEEDEANRFAADRLIPAAEWTRFNPMILSQAAIAEFAARLGIAPGIIVGRLQKEDRLGRGDKLNKLKKRYQWKED